MVTARPHILVVDDEAPVRRLLRTCFEGEGFAVSEAASASEVMSAIERRVDLVTLDLNLGDVDGLDVARQIRTRSEVPIIMVTGKSDTIDAVVGLELGADDYIAKPFHVREVVSRVKSVLRRTRRSETTDEKKVAGDAVRFGSWILDRKRRELRCAETGTSRDLTTGEFELLCVLTDHAQRVLSRDQILDHLKGHDWSPLDRSIDNQIARLRKKIEREPTTPELIKTVRGVGYTFTAKPAPA